MKKQILLILTTLLILTACTSQTDATSITPFFDVTRSQTPGFTPSSTSTLTITPAPKSTKTPRPTSTPTSTPEPSPTIPQPTLAAMSTLEGLVNAFPELKSSWNASISPNGRWAAFHVSSKDRQILKLIEIKGEKQWEINFHGIYGRQNDYADQSIGSVSVGHWSKDGNYVYLEPHPEWDGPGLWFGTGATLVRFNLTNGTWVDLNVGNSWSFSSNDKYLVYSADNGIHLRTLFTGSEIIFPVPEKFEDFGRFVWSPENNKFAFTATYGDWYDGKTGFSAFIVDVKNSSLKPIFEDDLRFLYPVEWTESQKIILYRYQYYETYYFDLTTNQIVLIPSP